MVVSSSLHYCASAAATLLLCVVVDAHLGDAILGLAAGRCACVRGHLLVVSADLPYNIVESVIDVDARFRRGFDELASELSCQVLAL